MSLTLSLAAPQTLHPPLRHHLRSFQLRVCSLRSAVSFPPQIPHLSSRLLLRQPQISATWHHLPTLVVTTHDFFFEVSLNDVKITGTPLFDDGNLIIFGVEDFFNSNCTTVSIDGSSFQCPENRDMYSFEEASGVLTSRGNSVLATFLDLQLLGFIDQTRLTIFAPVDGAIRDHVRGNFTNTASLILKHVIPCKMFWRDLVNLDDGVRLRTYSEGFSINVTKSDAGDTLMLNDVRVHRPDMHYNEWVVIHGIDDIVKVPARKCFH